MPPELGTEELAALIEVSKTINGHLKLNAVLESVMAVTAKVMHAEASSLVLKDEESGDLLFHVAHGEKAGAVKPIRMKEGQGIVGWVVQKGEPVIVNDVANDPRFYCSVDKESGFETRAILCVPMMSGESAWGAIEVLNPLRGDEFDEADLALCEAIAAQAAIAIENARLHKRIVQTERLAAVGETVAGMAHCIKNVLNGIQGGSFMVDSGLQKEDPSRTQKGWEIVSKNNLFLKDLVMDMLTYSKEREPEYEECDVNELVESVCTLMGAKAREQETEVVCTTAPDLGPVVVDPTGIRRCLMNLVSNAADACEDVERGAVQVTVEQKSGDGLRISVGDNGCGIEEEDRARLFKMFFSTKGSKGTGLGLPVTYKIIEEHGGTLTVESTVGEGTTFIIDLPLQKEVDSRSTNADDEA